MIKIEGVLQGGWLRESAPFNDQAMRPALWEKLNGIPGVKVAPERMTGFPTIPLQTLTEEAALEALLGVLTWVVDGLRTAPA